MHVEDVSAEEENDCNLSLNSHFPISDEYEEDSDSCDDSSPPPSPPIVTVSISSVEVDDNDDCEFGTPLHPVKHARHELLSDYGHAPPTFIGSVEEKECPATGMLATLNVSEELSTEEWWDD